MDTKLKNINYSTGLKAAAVILVWLCFLSICMSSVFLLYNNQIVASKSYYETSNFTFRFSDLARNVVELNVELKSEENIKASGKGTEFISDKLNRFQEIKDNLSNTVNLAYYIKNSETGETITNITASDPIALMKKQKAFAHYNRNTVEHNMPSYMQNDIMELLKDTSYEVYVAVIEPLKQGDAFYEGFTHYNKMKTFSTYALILLIISVVLMLIACIYLICVAGRREKGGEVHLSSVDKVYADLHTLWVLIAAVLSLNIAVSGFSDMTNLIAAAIILGIDGAIGITYVLSMIRQIKKGTLLKNTLVFSMLMLLKRFVKLFFDGKAFKPWTLFVLMAYGLINGLLFVSGTHIRSTFQLLLTFGLFLAFNIAAIYFASKALLSLTQIMCAAKEISKGNIDYPLESDKISVAFSGFAEDIKRIQTGLKKAVAEAIKGERMKTDLITNVSHDLKTPLTSIITYVDLLKQEELDNEKAEEYLSILEEKSERLKQLVEDLVEASKASSGNLVVNAEKVDLHELVSQAFGEYEEKISHAELDIRINTNDKKTFILADGKYMWRIIENLLSNALKYSMPHSRIYINIDQDDWYGSLTIKNMSAFPLDISPEQLTERFVRGDASRATEGSGLGLSIAQSLTTLQGGRFKIEIDGDLFKVNIEMPLWIEN